MRGVVPLGEKIVQLRRSSGLTQEMLAADCECDVKTIRNAEHSRSLDVGTLRRIAARLKVAYGDIAAVPAPDRRKANVATVERWIAAFNSRDAQAVAECFHQGGAVIVLADPGLPGAGEFRGNEQIETWAEICFATFLTEPITPSMYQLDAVGDLVFVRVERPRLDCLLNGNHSLVSVMWEFLVTDDRITQFRVYPESGAIERMVFSKGEHSTSCLP